MRNLYIKSGIGILTLMFMFSCSNDDSIDIKKLKNSTFQYSIILKDRYNRNLLDVPSTYAAYNMPSTPIVSAGITTPSQQNVKKQSYKIEKFGNEYRLIVNIECKIDIWIDHVETILVLCFQPDQYSQYCVPTYDTIRCDIGIESNDIICKNIQVNGQSVWKRDKADLFALPLIVLERNAPSSLEELQNLTYIPRKNIELTPVEQQLSAQSNGFAFNLLKTVYSDPKDNHKNILLSPLSATLALSMLNNGAAGTTGEEIRQTLGFGNVSTEEINTYAQKMVNAMQTLDTRGVFKSANSIWIQTGFPVFDAFKQVNRQYYDAEIQNLDLQQPAAVQTINNWVSNKTQGKIPEILNNIDPLERLLLVNSLYFNGYWTNPFDKQGTIDIEFRTSTGSKQQVPTMRKTERTHLYTKLENSAALELPFGNGAFSLVIVLPDEGTDISSVVSQMDGDWWTQVITGLEGPPYYFDVEVELPRFKLEYERTLIDDLIALGMKTAFD